MVVREDVDGDIAAAFIDSEAMAQLVDCDAIAGAAAGLRGQPERVRDALVGRRRCSSVSVSPGPYWGCKFR